MLCADAESRVLPELSLAELGAATGVRRRARSPLSRVCPLSPLETTQAHTGHREIALKVVGGVQTRPGHREAPTHATQTSELGGASGSWRPLGQSI